MTKKEKVMNTNQMICLDFDQFLSSLQAQHVKGLVAVIHLLPPRC